MKKKNLKIAQDNEILLHIINKLKDMLQVKKSNHLQIVVYTLACLIRIYPSHNPLKKFLLTTCHKLSSSLTHIKNKNSLSLLKWMLYSLAILCQYSKILTDDNYKTILSIILHHLLNQSNILTIKYIICHIICSIVIQQPNNLKYIKNI